MPHRDGRPTYADLAAAARVSPVQVKRDKQRGAPQETIEAYLGWRAANVQHYETAARQSAPSTGSLHVGTETARLRSAQADKEELEVAERRGELIPAEEVRQALLAASGVFASQLDALPGRLANELAALNDPAAIIAKLRDECHRIRTAAATALFAMADQAAEGSGQDGDAAPEADTGPMGRRDEGTASGLSRAGTVP